MRLLPIRGTHHLSTGWTSRENKPLQFQCRDDIIIFPISIQAVIVGRVDLVSSRNDDGANLKRDLLRLLLKIDGLTSTTGVHTLVTFDTIILQNRVDQRNSLIEWNRDCLPNAHIHVPLVGNLDGANIATLTTASTVIRNHIPRILPNFDPEVSHEAFYAEEVSI